MSEERTLGIRGGVHRSAFHTQNSIEAVAERINQLDLLGRGGLDYLLSSDRTSQGMFHTLPPR
ncbi:hypothetical protein ENINCK372B1_18355 [Enterobacter intestinihominis]